MVSTQELRLALKASELGDLLIEAKAAAQDQAEAKRAELLDRMASSRDPEEIRSLMAEMQSVSADVPTDLKLAVREANREYRELRAQSEPAEGVVRPATIETGTSVHSPGVEE